MTEHGLQSDVQRITLLDYVVWKVGRSDRLTDVDFQRAGVPFMGGCLTCHASLGGFNMYPTRNGWVSCKECLNPAMGFTSAEAFDAYMGGE